MTEEPAVLAGGCFRGMQDLMRRYDGVVSTRVGYAGGDVPNLLHGCVRATELPADGLEGRQQRDPVPRLPAISISVKDGIDGKSMPQVMQPRPA